MQDPYEKTEASAELIATDDEDAVFVELEVGALELGVFTDELLFAVEAELLEVELFAVVLLELPDLTFSLEDDAFCLPESLDFATLELDLALLVLDFFTVELEESSS